MTDKKEEIKLNGVSVEEPPKIDEKAEEITSIPSYRYGLQDTHFRKSHTFAKSFFGEKTIKKEAPHIDSIGQNPSICRKLFGLGYTAQRLVVNGNKVNLGLNQYSNHAWISQRNESVSQEDQENGRNGMMEVCLNCGSLFIDNKFYSYLDVERLEKEKEKQK